MGYPIGYEDRPTSPAQGYGIDEKAAYLQAKGQYATAAAPQESPINRLGRAVDRLSNAASFAYQTSDFLCGSDRIDGKGSAEMPSPEGLFAVMNALANQIERHTDTIQAAMERIHKIGG